MGLIGLIANFFKRKESKSIDRSIPPGIHYRKFYDNLVSTQHYCDLQLKQFPEKPPTTVLRSFNPALGTKNLFDFKSVEIWSKNLVLIQWNEEPLHKIPDLYLKQLENKNNVVWETPSSSFKGKIVIVDYDLTVVDGASEAQSDGFFDEYDLPPIDTWFYLASNKKRRNDLYAWIPDPYIKLTQEAIDVNCVEMIKWFE